MELVERVGDRPKGLDAYVCSSRVAGDGFLEITTIPTQGPIEISVVISVYIRKKI